MRWVNESIVESPVAFKVEEKPARTIKTTVAPTQYLRGLRAVAAPTLAQAPVNFSSASPKRATFGQNIQRPKITSNAGSRVRIVIIEQMIPIAPTGPSPRLLFN